MRPNGDIPTSHLVSIRLHLLVAFPDWEKPNRVRTQSHVSEAAHALRQLGSDSHDSIRTALWVRTYTRSQGNQARVDPEEPGRCHARRQVVQH